MSQEFVARNGIISKGNVIVTGSLTTSGSLTTTGTITATTLVVQTITSSISSITGSTNFGSLSSNNHVFTGSLNVTGALYIATGSVGIGTVSPSQLFEVVGGEIKAGRVDSSNEGGQISFGRSTDNATAWYIDAYGNTSSPQLRFVDVTGAAVRMTLTGSSLGIGTSTPNGNLEVYSSTPIIISGASSSGTLHGLEFRQSNTIDAYIKQLPATGELRLYVGRNSSWGGNMTFWTDTVQRMFISSGGEVRIQGAGGSQTAFSIYDGSTRRFFCIPSQYYGYIFGGQIAANNGKYFSFGNDAGSEVGFIQVTATGVNYTSNSSDIRKKKNFENWEETVLPYFKNINPQKFNYTIEEDGQSKTKGFIAQEMYDKFPEAYPLDLDGFHSFNPGGMVVYLIKAIQELEARVQELENK